MTKLHNELFMVLTKKFESNPRKYSVLYDNPRAEIYGTNRLSYTGYARAEKINKILYDYINQEQKFTTVEMMIARRKLSDVIKHKLPSVHHCYIVANDNIIIDPTYRHLLINHTGNLDKTFSPYAEFVYNLPPIFIGTEFDVDILIAVAENEKEQDILHCADNIIHDWYSNSELYSE